MLTKNRLSHLKILEMSLQHIIDTIRNLKIQRINRKKLLKKRFQSRCIGLNLNHHKKRISLYFLETLLILVDKDSMMIVAKMISFQKRAKKRIEKFNQKQK